jgi:hypothetical protein
LLTLRARGRRGQHPKTRFHTIDAMRFIRYSAEPPSEVREPVIQDRTDHRGSKPNGMWFSIVSEDGSDSWAAYCKGRGWATACCRTELFLNRSTVLCVQTKAEIDELTMKYGYCRVLEAEMHKEMIDYTRSAICWKRLAGKHDGIVIALDCAERDEQEWYCYSTWGCASGCVCRRNAIRGRLLPQV